MIWAFSTDTILPSFATKVVINDCQKFGIISQVGANVLSEGDAQ